ncbi:MAG: hemin uptake protein HemP [Betaproteobacteria bacterium]
MNDEKDSAPSSTPSGSTCSGSMHSGSTHNGSTHNGSTPPSRAVAPPVRRTIKSSDLLAGENELLIEHNGGVYSLRETSNGKLILTK